VTEHIVGDDGVFPKALAEKGLELLRSDPDAVRAAVRQRDEFDVEKMKTWLDNDNHDMRKEFREFLATEDIFQPIFDIKLAETRELARQRLNKVCERPGRFISVFDFKQNPRRVFAAHELSCLVDGSLATKITVQFNLFGGTVLKLGTERHEALLQKVDGVGNCGCFCLTEQGYGNNAIWLETTAKFIEEADQFEINTPTPNGAKYWITNGAIDAEWAVVFAQTIVRGKNEGVHGFLVQLRNLTDHVVVPGITVRDMGFKQGQNGVDNAQISFDHVQVPRTAMLNKHSDVDESGAFHSKGKSPRARFLVALNQLYSGRLCLASKAVGRAKQCLATAVKYSWSRLSAGPSGHSDYPILGFQLQERALMPLLARTFLVSGFGMNLVKDLFTKESTVGGHGSGELSMETMILCSGIKALTTASAERTISIARERCGGMGYARANVFADALTDAHAVMTAEGDNKVLLQKVSKEVINFYDRGVWKLPQLERRQDADFASLDYLLHLFLKRETELVKNIQGAMKGKPTFFDSWVLELSDQVQDLATAYLERVILENFVKELQRVDVSIRGMLELLGLLFAVNCVEENLAPFISFHVIEADQLEPLKQASRKLCRKISQQSLQLVDAFGIPQALLPPAARNWVRWNREDHQGEVRGFQF